ncbi:aldehyde dehydrogenase [Actinoplanes cyaneus]|uniref:Aldehyde dehydrogenase n=1 Tax=Actinoplanes cyaneus TaxID=52696 RepID=A0A919IKU2_9ACTN|nr:aldehyde dehydrogenase family protein [Actinoplanes cyaneus]MCW2138239.1 Acyl-CoA reductase [Actinoplanes cyaneus]GID66197.1 aldehyde dehydrogenase [Actinoplanes cyaneus]
MTTETIAVENPATGAVIDWIPATTPAGLDAAVRAAARAWPGWAAGGPAARRDALIAAGEALRGRAGEIAALLTAEQGKPLRQATAEVELAADWFGHTAGLSLEPERPDGSVTVERVPLGPVAAIAPSNFPIILAVAKLAPALLAGNTVVLKPNPLTPLTARRLTEVLGAVLPPDVLITVYGDGALGAALVAHPEIRMVSFTGSVPTGRAIAAAAAERFLPVVLELGGNDAAVVLPGADLARVAAGLFGGAMVNSGQFCAAIKRVYVDRGQAAELTEALAAAARATVLGDGADPASDLGPLVDRAGRDRVDDLVREAERAGARTVAGGRTPRRAGWFYPPTVVTDLPPGTRLEQEEQFGPVIPVIACDDVAEAVTRANGTGFGLGASVWGDPARAAETGRHLDAGTVWLNTHGELRHDVPFGGTRCSSVGVEYGYWGLLEYTRIRVSHASRA